ncbi:MAG TPA: alkaline phosphatase family protein [Candidatus Cybelea sp.]|nr:alkaline phosphatase family protein [Candidatus Cybelea sp.]
MRTLRTAGMAGALAAAIILQACGGNLSPAAPPAVANVAAGARPQSGSGLNKIQNVVMIIQENRSFDNLFQGFPKADTQSFGYDSTGKKVKLSPITMKTAWDVDHSSASFLSACNGTGSYPGTDCQMNGFNLEAVSCGMPGYTKCPVKEPQYAYVPPNETKPYFAMASQYVLADHMFTSNFDASSFVAHQYLIAAQSSSAVNYPNSNEWGCEGGSTDTIQTLTLQRKINYGHRIQVCFDNTTIGDELDAKNIPWAYYTAQTPTGDGAYWSAYSAIDQIYNGPDWSKDVISPQTQFFKDVKAGKLRPVNWITPTCENSDHAGCDADTGPAWVASLVNAIGKSKYWKSTAIFVVWDDYGGWYDHEPPKMLDYDGLGFRVPMLVISPYAKSNFISHKNYELASIVRFVEDRFGLAALSASDKRALSPAGDCFDFTQKPRQFKAIPAKENEDYFMHQAPDLRPVDAE